MLSGDDIVVLMGLMAAAVALAGFASLVTSIDRSAVGVGPAVISFQVRNLIVGAWCAVSLSLLPIGFDALVIAPHSLWQCASMAAAWVLAAVAARALAGGTHLRGAEGLGFSRSLFVASIGLNYMSVIVAVLGAAGLIPAKGAFLVSIFYLLYLTATLFYRMIQMADEAARSTARH
jgi:hypothetical protein